MATTPTPVTPASIRMPTTLRERLRRRAEQERRSFSAQCVVLLEEALDADRAADPEGPPHPADEQELSWR